MADLRIQLRQSTGRMDEACAAWALESESSFPSFSEPEASLLRSCQILETDITREKETLRAVQELLGRLTSLQTKKRGALQKKSDLENIYAHQLEELGSLVMNQHLSVPGSWSGAPGLFSDSDHYKAKYDFLLEKRARLSQEPKNGGFFHKVSVKANSVFTNLRLSRAEAKQKYSLARLALAIISDPLLRSDLESLMTFSSPQAQSATRELSLVQDQLKGLSEEEQQVRTAMEAYGAGSSPERRLAEIQRTVQALQSRLGDLRVRRGRSLFLEAQKHPEALLPWEEKHFGALQEMDIQCRQIQNDLIKYQAVVEIQALEDRNTHLSGKIRTLEEQILHLNQEITTNQRLIQEKRKISADILP